MENAFQPLPNPVVPPSQSFFLKIKNNKTVFIVLSICLFMLLSMGTYVWVAHQSEKVPTPPAPQVTTDTSLPVTETPTDIPLSSSNPTLTPTPTTNPVVSWKSYNNGVYGYSLKYPPDWIAKDLGSLEPKIPSYLAFNPNTASAGARFITISVSTRSYAEQLALGSANSSITVASILGTKQSFQDSDGNTSTAITIPRTNNLLVLRTKTAYLTIFNQILSTLKLTP